MIRLVLAISGIIAVALAVLAMIGGCGIVEATIGGLFCAILLMILGFVLWGLIVALRHIGAWISAGIIAFLILFWHHILPAVCVEVICHIIGVKA
jgi:hypothetical protein